MSAILPFREVAIRLAELQTHRSNPKYPRQGKNVDLKERVMTKTYQTFCATLRGREALHFCLFQLLGQR